MSLGELRRDYRRGLIVAISFCVFVMPVLLGNRPNDREDVNNILADSLEDEEHPQTLSTNTANDQGGLKIITEVQKHVGTQNTGTDFKNSCLFTIFLVSHDIVVRCVPGAGAAPGH